MSLPFCRRLPAILRLGVLAALLGALAPNPAARAADAPPTRSFDIPVGDAAVTLKAFTEQSGVDLVYSPDAVQGERTSPVRGDLVPRSALAQLLAGTHLTVSESPRGLLAVRKIERPKAQRATLAASPVIKPASGERLVRLDPFEVLSTSDRSYGALNSNAITRFRTELDRTPVSADILTAAFMEDVDATTIDGLLLGFGAGVGGSFANPAGQAALTQPGDRNTTSGFTLRGVNAGPIRLNGFVTESNNFSTTTNFDVERVELIHGAQGLLYGPSGAGGTIVATTDQARFDSAGGSVSERMDQFGSKRTVLKLKAGNDRIAGAFDFIDEAAAYRRLFFQNDTRGYYGQVAVRLPLRSTLRVDVQSTDENIEGDGASAQVSFGGTTNDPRSGEQLPYLLFTGQAGAINPATGRPFSRFGAIDNGHLTWDNVYSFPGITNWELAEAANVDVSLDTGWTSWLSTSLAFNYNRLNDLTGPGTTANMSAPGVNNNPLPNDWAMATNPGVSVQGNRRHKNFRAAALATNERWDGRLKSQTSLGYDFQRQGKGGANDGYYLSDANGNLILTPGGTNLGRTTIPTQYWAVSNGPVFEPANFPGRQAPLFQAADGKYYVKMSSDPNSPANVTALNPLGSAGEVPGAAGIANNPELADYQKEITSNGLYFANFSSWWDDRFTTLLGYRYTYTVNHIPNATPTAYAPPYDTAKFGAPSYSAGVTGRINGWLRWYVNYSANYNVSNGETDFYGRPVDETYGKGGEAGLKFTPLDSKVSGSLDFYVDNETDYAQNSGGPNIVLPTINPVGLNGQYEGVSGAGTDVAENRRSRGIELNLNASPLPNWRLRLAAVLQTGKVESNSTFGILYNDQFYTDAKGGVTYADGSPFLVPVNPGASVGALGSATNPAAILAQAAASGGIEQLTTAMIGDKSSPWYAWQGGAPTVNGQLGFTSASAASGTTSNVARVLKYFQLPGGTTALTGRTGLPISAIQYAWPDPNGTGGKVVAALAGTDTVGYPVYGINLVNSYQFDRGWLKGFGAVLALNDQWRWRTFLYNTPAPGPQQVLWGQRSLGMQINLNPFYERRFGRIVWRTQFNISNLTNHYVVELIPNNGAGFTNPNSIGVRWDNQPRSYSWTNTIRF